jgi:dienelactone hydrolase
MRIKPGSEGRVANHRGDPQHDRDQFHARSPLAQAARLTQPLLLGHGGLDQRVPSAQGELFHDAVTRYNKDVEWILYPDETQRWLGEEDDFDFWPCRALSRGTSCGALVSGVARCAHARPAQS